LALPSMGKWKFRWREVCRVLPERVNEEESLSRPGYSAQALLHALRRHGLLTARIA
jgi:hypothetical protein